MNNDAYPWHLARQYFIDIGLFLVMIVVNYVSLLASIECWGGELDWFQRSGSLTVVLASIIEYRHFDYYQSNHTHQSVLSGALSGIPFCTALAKLRKYIGVFSILFLIGGAVIWGYGDLPFV